jgi:hypothetical protein
VCQADADCGGFGKCVAGSCVCTSNAECTSMFADKCVQ